MDEAPKPGSSDQLTGSKVSAPYSHLSAAIGRLCQGTGAVMITAAATTDRVL